MTKDIQDYLNRLRQRLGGCDHALIQDALSDAEEHLTTALQIELMETPGLAPAEALAAIIEKYGSPEEVAAAYLSLEARFSLGLAAPRSARRRSFLNRFFGVVAEPRAWGAFVYALLALLTGNLYGLWAVIGGGFSLFSLVFIIGIPIAALFLLSVRGIALLEGRVVEALLGVRMPRKPFFIRRDLNGIEKLKALFTDRRTWRAFAYLILQLPLGWLYFSLIGGLFIFSLCFLAGPILELVFHLPLELLGTDKFTPVWLLPLVCLSGLLMLPGTLHLAKLAGRLHGRYAKALLVRK